MTTNIEATGVLEINPRLTHRLTPQEREAIWGTSKANPDVDFGRELISAISAKPIEPKDPYINERGV